MNDRRKTKAQLIQELNNLRDSAARKADDDRFRQMFLNNNAVKLLIDIDSGDIVDANPAAAGFYGYDIAALKRLKMSDLAAGKTNREHAQNAATVTAETDGLIDHHRLASGEIREVEVHSGRVETKQDRLLYVIIHDVTERRQIERHLARSERLRAVADLAGGVAHHFNNFLQVVIGSADLALGYLGSGEDRAVATRLRQILEAAEVAAQVIKTLGEYSRVADSDQGDHGTVFDLSATVDHAVEMARPWWKTEPEMRGISIAVNRSLQPGCFVRGLESGLFEAALNILRNAVEALPAGGAINVSTLVRGDEVLFSVTDNGVGIPEQDRQHVFEPFWTTKGFRGTGMGLAATFSIVQRHGGEIDLESREGEGTVFTVRLPSASPVEEFEEEVPIGLYSDLELCILIVDDAKVVVQTLSDQLRRRGQTVLTALSGEEAVAILAGEQVDAIVCDLAMPSMNGWQVAKAAAALCRDRGVRRIPFILLTGWAGQLLEAEKIDDSAVDWVVEKPVDSAQLLEVIRHVVSKVRAEGGLLDVY